jgi:hypothetical protein
MRTMGRIGAIVVGACVAWGLAAVPAAAAWYSFSLAGEELIGGSTGEGLAVLQDGSILRTRGGTRVSRTFVDGTAAVFAGGSPCCGPLGDGGPADKAHLAGASGLAVTSDGGVLIADSGTNLVRRVGADGTITTVAGTPGGMNAYAGDGGPATAALLCGPTDVAALPGGGFLIADSGNRVVRRVAADGTITTVAGVGAPPPYPTWPCEGPGTEAGTGDGGPATAATLAGPREVAPVGGGGFVIADERLRWVRPDGAITTLALGEWTDSAEALPDGRLAISIRSRVGRRNVGRIVLGTPEAGFTTIAGGGQTLRPHETFFEDEGLAASRLPSFGGILAADPLGGLLVSVDSSLTYPPPVVQLVEPPSARAGVAIRAIRDATYAPKVGYISSAPAQIRFDLRRSGLRLGGRSVARWTRTAQSGYSNVRLPRVQPGLYMLVIRAVAANGSRDGDRLTFVSGGRLSKGVAAGVVDDFFCECGDAPDEHEHIARCRRFRRDRVDCKVASGDQTACERAVTVVLRKSGLVWAREYGCPVRRKAPRAPRPHPTPLADLCSPVCDISAQLGQRMASVTAHTR